MMMMMMMMMMIIIIIIIIILLKCSVKYRGSTAVALSGFLGSPSG